MPVGEGAQAAPLASYKSHKPRRAAQDYISQPAGPVPPSPPPRAARHGSARRGGRWRRGPGEPGGGAMPELSQVPRRRAGPGRGMRARPGSARDAGPGEAAGVSGRRRGSPPGSCPDAAGWSRCWELASGSTYTGCVGFIPAVVVPVAGPGAGCRSRGWEYPPGSNGC